MSTGALVHLELDHGDKIAAGFKAAPRAMGSALRRSHRQTAKVTIGWLRPAAQAGTPQQRHMARGIRATSTTTAAIVAIQNGASSPGALGAFLGSKRWHQFPGWVGAGWSVGVAGEGPLVINPTLAKHEGDIETLFLQGQLDALAGVIPRL